jgi:hypothetical protein
LGYLVWDIWFGIFGLGYLVWDILFGNLTFLASSTQLSPSKLISFPSHTFFSSATAPLLTVVVVVMIVVVVVIVVDSAVVFVVVVAVVGVVISAVVVVVVDIDVVIVVVFTAVIGNGVVVVVVVVTAVRVDIFMLRVVVLMFPFSAPTDSQQKTRCTDVVQLCRFGEPYELINYWGKNITALVSIKNTNLSLSAHPDLINVPLSKF